MLTNANDLTLVLSGGAANLNPNAALGGDPSSTPITDDVINNLFSDVSKEETVDGIEDYRCIYVFNDGETSVYNVSLWIEDFVNGADMEIGVESRNESQRITISGAIVTGGSFTLSYKANNFVSNYNSDLGVWSAALQTAINALLDDDDNPYFHQVTVIAQSLGTSIIFDIIFNDLDAKRNFDKFLVVSNDLTPTVSILVTTTQEGAPINTIASEINVSTTPPGGVGFFAATSDNPIVLPIFNPSEGFPVWIKRTVSSGSIATENDGFILKIRAESLLPA
jgi:hypothetical protein